MQFEQCQFFSTLQSWHPRVLKATMLLTGHPVAAVAARLYGAAHEQPDGFSAAHSPIAVVLLSCCSVDNSAWVPINPHALIL
jgi:hypothetical protein